MTMIPILYPPDADGVRASGDIEESALIKTTGESENDNEQIAWVEYRFPGSDVIVHRSCAVQLKQWPSMQAIAQPLT